MGELGAVRRYPYWADRRIREIVADNDIKLDRRWRLGFKTPMLGIAPQVEFNESPAPAQRNQIADIIERAIGKIVVEDFVTPSPAAFVKGCGKVTFAAYMRLTLNKEERDSGDKRGHREAGIIHTRTVGSDGTRAEICLFASIHNFADYLSYSEAPMWSSSSTRAIEEFISCRGKRKSAMYDDDESIAVEILRTLSNEGMTDERVFRRFASAEWFAEVYHDVTLRKERWDLRPGTDLPEPVDRIVIGAPLWVRTSS